MVIILYKSMIHTSVTEYEGRLRTTSRYIFKAKNTLLRKARSKQFLVKRIRAIGGCLGIDRRRRTCYLRKASASRKGRWPEDIRMGEPNRTNTLLSSSEYIGREKRDLPNWNILVGRGKEIKRDSLSSGERNGTFAQTTRFTSGVVGPIIWLNWKRPAKLSGKWGDTGW